MLLGAVTSYLGHGLLVRAQARVGIGVTAISVLGNTVLVAIGGWLVYDEALGALQLVGAVLVLIAVGAILLEPVPTPAIAAD